MDLKIGDKVKFLNEKGEGVISRRINKNTMGVIIEDGFEIPYLISELVTEQITQIVLNPIIKKEETRHEQELSHSSIPEITDELKGVYFAFSPENALDIVNTNFNAWLINHTEYAILYTYSILQQGKYNMLESGRLQRGECIIVETINRKSLHDYSTFKLDILFYSEELYLPQAPASEIVKLKPIKLYKQNAFVPNAFIEENALIIKVIRLNDERIRSDIQAHLNDALFKKSKNVPAIKMSKLHISNDPTKEMELDLHIEELLDDYSGMSNYEIVQVQLHAFQNALDNAIGQHCRSLTVIHGIGTGKLKQEIRNMLKTTYPKMRFEDASYSKYGLGATEIFLY
jgi:hypothetical protein